MSSTLGHSWYPQYCCSAQDCSPINCEELIENNDGSYNYGKFKFSREQVHPSEDAFCHVCMHPESLGLSDEKRPICLFIQSTS